MQSFTQEDLLLYLYKETSREKTAAIEAALKSDWALRESLETLKADFQPLATNLLSPRQETIDKILRYAEKAVEEVSHA